MIYYIKAKISVRVRGISGAFNETCSHLVHANTPREAQDKFEAQIRRDKADAAPQDIIFEYLEVATPIF